MYCCNAEVAEFSIESDVIRKGELRALVSEMVREIGAKENNNDEKENPA